LEGDLSAAPPDTWHVVVANIAPGPVIEAASLARALLQPGGVFIGGGIPVPKLGDVVARVRDAGFVVERTGREETWGIVVARRRYP
jgi:ribosomal protein L11 methylase PrmA